MPHRFGRALAICLALPSFGNRAAVAEPVASFVQSYVWQEANTAFGGFSGFELADDGLGFIALSDRATLWRGQLQRDVAGEIIGVKTAGPVALHDSTGKLLSPRTGDSEGLALASDGSVFVSFEGLARVAHYPTDSGPAEKLPRPEAFAQLQRNSSFEALAIAPDGTLYTLPERSGATDKPFPIWRYKAGAWDQPLALPRDGTWLPVAADFGPDGRLYILERDFWAILGFLSRVRVFDISATELTGGAVVVQTGPNRHDNLEGLALWQDAAGDLRLTMISDDNFTPFQRTEIVEYRLSP